jgi:thymidylate kinase
MKTKKIPVQIISFSGLDGCGKSTQISLLSDELTKNNQKFRVIWARPGSTPVLMKIKAAARKIRPSLPKAGRSSERQELLQQSNVGHIWFILSFVELIVIYSIYAYTLRLIGYVVIFDRHLQDAIIDYEIMLSKPLNGSLFIQKLKSLLHPNVALCLKIDFESSVVRCAEKYEPFPDTDDEKKIRITLYEKYIAEPNFKMLDGSKNKFDISKEVIGLLYEN